MTSSDYHSFVKELLNKGDFEETVIYLTEDITANKNALSYLKRGVAYYYLKRFDEAIQDFNMALDLDDKLVIVYNLRAETYRNLNNLQKAIEDYDKILELDDKVVDVYHNRGVAYYDLNEFDKAIENFDSVLRIDNTYFRAYYMRGNTYIKLNNFEKAVENYNKVLAFDDKVADAYHNRGVAYYNLDRFDKAIEDFDQVLELGDKSSEAYFNRGSAYSNLGKLDEALEDLNAALEYDNKLVMAYHNRGLVYYKLNKPDLAIKDFDEALRLDDKHVTAYNGRGGVYYTLNKSDSAIRDFNKALQLDNTYDSAYFNRAFCHLEHFSFDKVTDDLNCAFYFFKNVDGVFLAKAISFFRDHTDTIHLPRLILDKLPDAQNLINFQDYFETCLARSRPFEDFFELNSREDSREILLSRALTHYYMGNEGAAFDIFDMKIDAEGETLSLTENYYYAVSARVFGKIHGVDSREKLLEWENCTPANTPQERYYLAWHHWMTDNKQEAIEISRKNSAYLPSLYQLLLFTQDEKVKNAIIESEAALPESQQYAGSYQLNVSLKDNNYSGQLFNYVQYAELEEAIRMINPAHKTRRIDQVIGFDDADYLHKLVVKKRGTALLDEILDEKRLSIVLQDSRMMAEEISGFHQHLKEEFKRIESVSSDPVELEMTLAGFIHSWQMANHFKQSKMKVDAAEYYEKIIRYFLIADRIKILDYCILYCYIKYRHKIVSRVALGAGGESTLEDILKDLLKTTATASPAAILSAYFDPSWAALSSVLLAPYLAKIGVSRIVELLDQSGMSDRGADEDYRSFKNIFIENSIKEILKTPAGEFFRSAAYKSLEQFYKENSEGLSY